MTRLGMLTAALIGSVFVIAPAIAQAPGHGVARGGSAPAASGAGGFRGSASGFARGPSLNAPANFGGAGAGARFAANNWNRGGNGSFAGNRDFDRFHHFRGGAEFGFAPGGFGSFYDDYAYDDYPYYETYAYEPAEPYVAAGPAPDQGYCMSRYRSYDPATGTYLGFDGLRHPCP